MAETVAALLANGQPAQAAAMAAAALSRGIRHPVLFTARGLHLNELGLHADALFQFENAWRLNPGDLTALDGIAICQGRLGQFGKALAATSAAAKIDPNRAATHYLSGWALELQGDNPEAARQFYERTLELNPDHVGAMAGAAAIAMRVEDWTSARFYAERLIKLDTQSEIAEVVLAACEIEENRFEEAAIRLRRQLVRLPSSSLRIRAMATGLFADALDGLDRVGEAFAAYVSENEYERSLHSYLESPDTASTLKAVQQFMEELPPGRFVRGTDGGSGNRVVKQHVFLLGFPRSGTTLLEQILASHPDVNVLEERECMADIARKYATTRDGLNALPDLAFDEVIAARAAYWRAAEGYGARPTGAIFVDKVPLHTIKLPLIAKLFPNAKILFATRDPRDVVLSCFRRHFQVSAATYPFLTLMGTANMYDCVMQIGQLARERLPINCLLQRHEDLVIDFENELGKICEFIGMPWSASMSNFAADASRRRIRSLSAGQVRRGLNQDGIGQWKRYRSHLAPILPIVQPWIDAFGYPPE